MFRIVCRDSRRARTMPRRSPFTSVTPALSIAMSVPVPIAMPTSAAASAGASLMPSPAMATLAAFALQPFDLGHLVLAASPPPAPRRCRASAPRRARSSRCRRSASRCGRPSARSARIGLDRAQLHRIGDAEQAGGPAVDRDEDDRLSVVTAFLGLAGQAPRSSAPSDCISVRLPTATARVPTRPTMPRPVCDSNDPACGDQCRPRASAPLTIAAASGCSLARSTLAASSQHVLFS